MLTQRFADAVVEAEQVITAAPHVRTEQDLVEGYDYLAGSIRASLQMAWAYQRDYPFFVRSTGPYTKMGLDNPDTLYFHSYLRDDGEYVVTGRRGTTADLSFQVLAGDYSPVDRAGQPDRVRRPRVRDRRRRHVRTALRPGGLGGGAELLPAGAGLGDADRARGVQRLERAAGHDPHPPRGHARHHSAAADRSDAMAKRYGVAGKILLSPAAHVPEVPRVVLPEAAGEHDDRAPADAGRAERRSSPRPVTTTSPTTRR